MSDRKPMLLVFAGPNGSDFTFETVLSSQRKHKEDISVFPNELWSEEELMELIG